MKLTDYWVDGKKIAAIIHHDARTEFRDTYGYNPTTVREWTAEDEALANSRHGIEIKIDGLTPRQYEDLHNEITQLVADYSDNYEITGGTR